ncbi:asparagine synthase (glutamine-hydrolyzing) [Coprobacter sp.]
MCGIAGIVGEVPNMKSLLKKMSQAQLHRGPDHAGSWISWVIDSEIGMVHNRLAVKRIKNTSEQPYIDEDTGLILVYDGNIYNHADLRKLLSRYYTFCSETEEEVILKAYHRWGRSCLDHFNGIFSIAIYDRSARSLFMARDRFGVKPLYFALQKGNLYFASEIKALFAAGIRKQISPRRWAGYLVYSTYGMPYETFWDEVYQLPAGYCLFFNSLSLDVQRWYEFDKAVQSVEIPNSETDAAERFLSLAEESVRYNFDAAVPVGFNLSGGFDSSFLLGLIHRLSPHEPLKVYSYYGGDKFSDEILWTGEMLSHTRYNLEQVQLTPDMVVKEAVKIARVQDEPYDGFSSLAYARLFRTARRQGTVVLCDGLGLDEVWARYPQNGNKTESALCSCLKSEFKELAHLPEYPHPFQDEEDNLRYRDLFYERIPHILRFNDRVSMMHSTELRKPFLDHRLIEYAFALPHYMKERACQDKWMVRQIASQLLPDNVRLAPKGKAGRSSRMWLSNELQGWVGELINELKDGVAADWIDGEQLSQAWKGCLQEGAPVPQHLWKWINLHIMLNKVL